MSRSRRRARWRTRWHTRFAYLRSSGRLRRTLLYGVGGLAVLGLAWIVITGLVARSEANKVEARLQQVKAFVAAGQITDAERVAAQIPAMTDRAHRLTTGPAWWIAAQVPYFGRPLDIIRTTTDASDEVGSQGIPALLQVATKLDPSTLRTSGKTIALGPLTAAEPKLSTAAAALDSAIAKVSALPQSSWLGSADRLRASFETQLRSIDGYVDAASRASKVLPTMLGADGPKRYFIGLQNEAEMRGTGGLPGAFAIVVADHGTLTFTHFESDSALLPAATHQQIATGLDFGADYNAAYGASVPTSQYLNSNLSPNFPYAAQIWASMWEKVSGEHIDGAVGLDPAVLARFLAATGPVSLPDGSQITADTVVPLTEQQEYAIFSNNNERKAYLVSVLKAASTALISGRASAVSLARAVSDMATQQRFLVWTSDKKAEAVIAGTNYGGAIPDSTQPFVGAVVNNIAAGKLDYYLVRTLTYRRSGCGSSRDVLVTITLTNTAPASGLPAYVDTRLDKHSYPVKPGDNRTQLDYYATDGAELRSVTLNDKPSTAAVQTGLGHPIFRMDLELPRGTTQTIVLHLTEPAGKGAPVIWKQPGVTPMTVTSDSQSCG